MTQHLGTPPRPWAGLETHLYVVSDSPSAPTACNLAPARTALSIEHPDTGTARCRKLAKLSLVLGYLARKRAGASADIAADIG